MTTRIGVWKNSSAAHARADGGKRLLSTCLAFQPGGLTEISRWCKPPVRLRKCTEPPKGRRNSNVQFPTPFQGLALTFATNRWFAPPANFPGASGAKHQISLLHLTGCFS